MRRTTIEWAETLIGVAILLYLVHGLRLTPALLGPLCAVGGISAVLGAAAASRLHRRWGLDRTMVSSLLLASVAGLCLPLPGGPVWLIVGLLAAQMIQQVLDQPAWQGRLTARDLRVLTPLNWQHINPYGTFLLDMRQRLHLELAA